MTVPHTKGAGAWCHPTNRDPDHNSVRQAADRRLPDRCEVCGRFIGQYPVGFYCDVHCRDCTCRHCEP